MSDADDLSIFELFRMEAEERVASLQRLLLQLQDGAADKAVLHALMRDAHSLKGAARITEITVAVGLTHAMEDRFVAAEDGRALTEGEVDVLLRAVDLLRDLGELPDEGALPGWEQSHRAEIDGIAAALSAAGSAEGVGVPAPAPVPETAASLPPVPASDSAPPTSSPAGEVAPATSVAERPKPTAGTPPVFDLPRPTVGTPPPFDLPKPSPGAPPPFDLPRPTAGGPQPFDPPKPTAGTPPAFDLPRPTAGAPPAFDLPRPTPGSPPPFDLPKPVGTPPVFDVPTPIRPGAEVRVATETVSADTAAASSLRMSSARLRSIMAASSNNLVRQQSLVDLSKRLLRAEERMQQSLQVLMNSVDGAQADSLSPHITSAIRAAFEEQQGVRQMLRDLDSVAYGSERVANGLHREVLQSTMRPVREVVPSWQRLVRTVAVELGKKVKLEVVGERTDVDRDILEQLRAPMEHLLRNSLDHGLEAPSVRAAAGKPRQGTLRVWARHQNGRLAITVSDDGGGVDFRAVRARAESRGLVLPSMAAKMSEDEVLQFLFLPGFSTRDTVSELSGRGFGLDVVQNTVHGAGGSIRIETKLGQGTAIHLTLPISRSVLRVMLVTAEDETYGLPTTRLARVDNVMVNVDANGFCTVGTAAGRVPIVPLTAAMGGTARPLEPGRTPAIFLLDTEGNEAEIALAVDRLLGDSVVAVQEVDPRLGRGDALAGVILTETGLPRLILAADYLLRIALGIHRQRWSAQAEGSHAASVLVADDSPTVRQMLRRVLLKAQYRVVVAEHGAEAWALLQTQPFDLLISDVDMPEMNGIELTTQVRDSARLKHTPVILLSYKGRDEDRQRGLEAGADMYFSKGEFEEKAFLQVVTDMIGPATLENSSAGKTNAVAAGQNATA